MENSNLEFKPYLNEYEIVQNAVIGAHCLYKFVSSYSKYDKEQIGVRLPFCFIVLPIVFNKEYADAIYRRQYSRGSFIKVLTSNEVIFDGIQKRMEDLSDISFRSLGINFDANLLNYDNETARVFFNKTVKIFGKTNKDKGYDTIIKASSRLGAWFAQIEDEQLLAYLNIRF